MAVVLVAEDDPQIREWVGVALEADRHEVRLAADGAAALASYAERRPDLLVLDIMMPKKSGYEVCQEIRRGDPALPILMLTAKGSESDKVLGLSLGADDYLVKPFGVRELCARVSALLRRAYATETSRGVGDTFKIGSHEIDARRGVISAGDGSGAAELSPQELALLRLFAAHPGEILDRDRLLNEVWGANYFGTTRTLDQRVVAIRRKLGADASLVETIYGRGYRYAAP